MSGIHPKKPHRSFMNLKKPVCVSFSFAEQDFFSISEKNT